MPGGSAKAGVVTRAAAKRKCDETLDKASACKRTKASDKEMVKAKTGACVTAFHNLKRYATKMQRFRTHKIATDAAKYGMTCAIAKTIPFAELSARLRDPSVVKSMGSIFRRVWVLTRAGIPLYPRCVETKSVNVRVFLASFTTAYHASDVFESINQREKDLTIASIEMLQVFDEICVAIQTSKLGTDIQDQTKKALQFPEVLHKYLEAFHAWKVPDAEKLGARINHALTALYQAEDLLVEGDEASPRLQKEFRSQQARLENKLLQISGAEALKVNSKL
jgi:hypothetical protein